MLVSNDTPVFAPPSPPQPSISNSLFSLPISYLHSFFARPHQLAAWCLMGKMGRQRKSTKWQRQRLMEFETLLKSFFTQKKMRKNRNKHSHFWYIINLCIPTTLGIGSSMPWCATVPNSLCTHTHVTHFGNTSGSPAPILNLSFQLQPMSIVIEI